MKLYTIRLKPGADIKKELILFTAENKIMAGFIVSCVGSLTQARVRMPNQAITDFNYPSEIISLMGTLSQDDVHLHISFSYDSGKVFGGHMKEGCIVNTTAEIVIGEDENKIFRRVHDSSTGFTELVVVDK